MRVLLVMDHKFFHYENKVYDVFRIDQKFFEDYAAEFDQVGVLARLVKVDQLPVGARRSDSSKVFFIEGIKYLG